MPYEYKPPGYEPLPKYKPPNDLENDYKLRAYIRDFTLFQLVFEMLGRRNLNFEQSYNTFPCLSDPHHIRTLALLCKQSSLAIQRITRFNPKHLFPSHLLSTWIVRLIYLKDRYSGISLRRTHHKADTLYKAYKYFAPIL